MARKKLKPSHFGTRGLTLWGGIATLVGSVVGAGILGIPYAIASVGFSLGLSMLIGLTALNIILQLIYAELILRTKEDHQMPGYSGMYLGKSARGVALILDLLSGYGTLLAYLVGIGHVLFAVLGWTPFAWSMVMFVLMGIIVFKGLEAIKRFEIVLTMFIFLIVFLIATSSAIHIDLANLMYTKFENMAIPYGVLLFALAGNTAIPQIRRAIVGYEKSFPKVILASNGIILVLYVTFMFIVLGVTGAETTEVGTIGLGERIGPLMIVMGNVLAVFTISTSYLTNGLAMRRIFQYDYGKSRIFATGLTLAVPLGLFLIGARDFIKVIGLVGGVLLGSQSAMIIFTYWKAYKQGTRKPEFSYGPLYIAGSLLLTVFAIGAIITIVQ